MQKHIIYIISNVDRAIAFEWIADHLDKSKYRLSFIILGDHRSELETFLRTRGIPVTPLHFASKKDWPRCWWSIRRQLAREKPHAVHCHLIDATILGLTAASAAGVRRRFYTRHHSSLHHIYHRKGVFWDKLNNRMATRIIAISGVVRDILVDWEGADPAKVVLIHHGFLLDAFRKADTGKLAALREKYSLPESSCIVGVISRFTKWKGVQFIIPAFADFLAKHPGAVLMLFNAGGDYEAEIDRQLAQLPAVSWRRIEFEKDILTAWHLIDYFVHTPIDEHSEAFGQIYVEALAAGIPSIFTLSGIARDFIADGENALVVPFQDTPAIAAALEKIAGNPDLRQQLIARGLEDVQRQFSLDVMIAALNTLYAV